MTFRLYELRGRKNGENQSHLILADEWNHILNPTTLIPDHGLGMDFPSIGPGTYAGLHLEIATRNGREYSDRFLQPYKFVAVVSQENSTEEIFTGAIKRSEEIGAAIGHSLLDSYTQSLTITGKEKLTVRNSLRKLGKEFLGISPKKQNPVSLREIVSRKG